MLNKLKSLPSDFVKMLKSLPELTIQMWSNLNKKFHESDNETITWLLLVTLYCFIFYVLSAAAEYVPGLAVTAWGIVLVRLHVQLNRTTIGERTDWFSWTVIVVLIGAFMWTFSVPNIESPLQFFVVTIGSSVVILFHFLGAVAHKRSISAKIRDVKVQVNQAEEFDLFGFLQKISLWLILGYVTLSGICIWLFSLMINSNNWNPWLNCLTIPVSLIVVFVFEWTAVILFIITATGFTIGAIINAFFKHTIE